MKEICTPITGRMAIVPRQSERRLALPPQDRSSTVRALEEAKSTACSSWELLFHDFEDEAQGTLDWQIIVSG